MYGCQGGCGPEKSCQSNKISNINQSPGNSNKDVTIETTILSPNCTNVYENVVATINKKKNLCCNKNNTANDKLEEKLDPIIDMLDFAINSDSNCSCKNPSEGVANGCCMVICLKTLESFQNSIGRSVANFIKCNPNIN